MLTRNAYFLCLHLCLHFLRAVMGGRKKSSRNKKVGNYGGAPPEFRLLNVYLLLLRYYKETSNLSKNDGGNIFITFTRLIHCSRASSGMFL